MKKIFVLTAVLVLLVGVSVAFGDSCGSLNQLQSSGLITEFNIDYNEVYVDPAVWYYLPLKGKKGMILIASDCFERRGSTGRVTVYNGLSGKKVASLSSWSGITFY